MKHIYNGSKKGQLKRTSTEIGESIETKIRRAIATNEPIEDTAAVTYTERKDGVMPQFDMRTDRQELALDAIDKYNKSAIAKSDEKIEEPKEEQKEENKE